MESLAGEASASSRALSSEMSTRAAISRASRARRRKAAAAAWARTWGELRLSSSVWSADGDGEAPPAHLLRVCDQTDSRSRRMLLLPGEPAPDTPPDSPRRADAGDGGGAGGATSGASRWSALQASATSAEVAATAAGGGGGAAADGGGAAATPYLRILGAVRAFKSMGSSVVSSVSGESPAVAAAEEEEEEEGEEEGEAAAEAEAVALEGDSQVFSLEAALRPSAARTPAVALRA